MATQKTSAPWRAYERVHTCWLKFVTPTASGLPNWRVIVAFPILVVVVLGIFVALGWSGTSSGVHAINLGIQHDPRLISGVPRPIRSDEWLVQQGWVVSQNNSGYPVDNDNFPGGTNLTLLNELPTWDWSSVFRPHLWGYLLFGLDVGVAWHWLVPAMALLSGAYLLVLGLAPRRPVTAALIAVGTYFMPFIQWWYTPSTVWSIAWPILAMAGTIWIMKDQRGWVRWTWSGILGYTAITLAMGLYVPYILPGVLAYLAFLIGSFLRQWRSGDRIRELGRRVLPLVVCGFAAIVVLVVWVLTRLATVSAIMSTVYPGQRSEHTGVLLSKDPYLTGLGGFPWNQSLKMMMGPTVLGGNSSESSGVLLLAVFVVPGLIWLLVARWRRTRRLDLLVVASLVFLLVVGAYLFVPGWDAIAHLLQIDRVPAERFRIVFVVLLPLFAGLVIEGVDQLRSRWTWGAGILSALFTAGIILALYLAIKANGPDVLAMASRWKYVVVAIVLAVFLLFVRRAIPVAAVLILGVSLVMGWGVNPVYHGIFDLSAQPVGQSVEKVDRADPGVWISVGSAEARSTIVETGVEAFTGVQNFPNEEMWTAIDPKKTYEYEWNRLGHVAWTFDSGEPRVTNPQPDVIQVTFDPCSTFAQNSVRYVLADSPDAPQSCLARVKTVNDGTDRMNIYQVVPSK